MVGPSATQLASVPSGDRSGGGLSSDSTPPIASGASPAQQTVGRAPSHHAPPPFSRLDHDHGAASSNSASPPSPPPSSAPQAAFQPPAPAVSAFAAAAAATRLPLASLTAKGAVGGMWPETVVQAMWAGTAAVLLQQQQPPRALLFPLQQSNLPRRPQQQQRQSQQPLQQQQPLEQQQQQQQQQEQQQPQAQRQRRQPESTTAERGRFGGPTGARALAESAAAPVVAAVGSAGAAVVAAAAAAASNASRWDPLSLLQESAARTSGRNALAGWRHRRQREPPPLQVVIRGPPQGVAVGNHQPPQAAVDGEPILSEFGPPRPTPASSLSLFPSSSFPSPSLSSSSSAQAFAAPLAISVPASTPKEARRVGLLLPQRQQQQQQQQRQQLLLPDLRLVTAVATGCVATFVGRLKEEGKGRGKAKGTWRSSSECSTELVVVPPLREALPGLLLQRLGPLLRPCAELATAAQQLQQQQQQQCRRLGSGGLWPWQRGEGSRHNLSRDVPGLAVHTPTALAVVQQEVQHWVQQQMLRMRPKDRAYRSDVQMAMDLARSATTSWSDAAAAAGLPVKEVGSAWSHVSAAAGPRVQAATAAAVVLAAAAAAASGNAELSEKLKALQIGLDTADQSSSNAVTTVAVLSQRKAGAVGPLPPISTVELAERIAQASAVSWAGFIRPVDKEWGLSSGFGPRWGRHHNGVDLAAPTGEPVLAADGGTVTYAGWEPSGFGNLVEITHDDGWRTLYGHTSKIYASTGQRVRRGECIALVGETGRATGPHLHWEIRNKRGCAVNPAKYIQL